MGPVHASDARRRPNNAHVLHYGEHEDPCKMAYSRFALTRRHCVPCEGKQIKARTHMLSDCVSDIMSWPVGNTQRACSWRAAAAGAARRVACGIGAGAAHLSAVKEDREEVEAPLSGALARLGLEPSSHHHSCRCSCRSSLCWQSMRSSGTARMATRAASGRAAAEPRAKTARTTAAAACTCESRDHGQSLNCRWQ